MKLAEYVQQNAIRGACTCGRCIDAGPDPENHQPDNHTVDLTFFKVAKGDGATAQEFESLVQNEFLHWLDGEEHNYLELGADIGDQGLALTAMGLGHLLGIWELLAPAIILPFLTKEQQLEIAGRGMVSIRRGRKE